MYGLIVKSRAIATLLMMPLFRVPFIVSGTTGSTGAVRETALTNTVDLFPTISEAAGVTAHILLMERVSCLQ